MEILHLSDTHLGRRGRADAQGASLTDQHLWAFRQALKPAFAGEVGLVLHTGDVFDRSRPPPRAMAQAAALLRELARRVPVLILGGNHDRDRLHRSLPMGVPGLHVVRGAASLDVAGLRLACVNYVRDAAAWGRAARKAWGGGADLLLCHQAVDGARVPRFTFRVGRQRDTVGEQHLPPGARWVLCGHIHPRQVVRVGGAQVVHPGATVRTSHAEGSEPKSVVRWSLGRCVQWAYTELPSPPKSRPPEPQGLRGSAQIPLF